MRDGVNVLPFPEVGGEARAATIKVTAEEENVALPEREKRRAEVKLLRG